MPDSEGAGGAYCRDEPALPEHCRCAAGTDSPASAGLPSVVSTGRQADIGMASAGRPSVVSTGRQADTGIASAGLPSVVSTGRQADTGMPQPQGHHAAAQEWLAANTLWPVALSNSVA